MNRLSRSLKITFLLPGYPTIPIGGFRIVYQYANEMASRGHLVTIIHPLRILPLDNVINSESSKKPDIVRKVWRNLRNYRIYLSKPSPIQWQSIDYRVKMVYHFGLPRLNDFPDADILIATAVGTAPVVEQAPISKGKKFYLIQHFESIMGNSEEAVLKTWRGKLRKIVISKWLYNLGKDNGIGNMSYVPNAIDHGIFNVKDTVEHFTRPASVLSLWHNAPWKGSLDALAALQIIHSKYPDLKISFFGTHDRPTVLPSWINYFRSPSQMQLVEIYNAHAIYLSASKSEGSALTPMEAMACGCCFIGTRIGGFLDYAIDEKNSLLGPIENPAMLAGNLLRVIESPALLSKLSQQGCEDIRNFSWDRSAAAFESVLLQFSEENPAEKATVD